MNALDDELLTLKEAGERLRVSPSTIARMIDRRELAVTRLGGQPGRPLRFRRRDVDDALASWSHRGAQ
ncbi:MAG TPA: helix-turn-helix domain-containing protein [Candidatus Nitrosopolaris sp.]|nr:helix-turn-helix domain-containing protein [Candidatus Nitrosopolaris sp.]